MAAWIVWTVRPDALAIVSSDAGPFLFSWLGQPANALVHVSLPYAKRSFMVIDGQLRAGASHEKVAKCTG